MNDEELQQLVERVSVEFFHQPFLHRATFNVRLRTSGGRYFLASHNIEMNPHHLVNNGLDAFIRSVKHELCHYHLHRNGRGYRHADPEFKDLLTRVGGSRHCPDTGLRRTVSTRYTYICTACRARYERKRVIDVARYVCGRCRGRLRLLSPVTQEDPQKEFAATRRIP